MALTSGTDLDRHNPDHPPGPLIGLTFAAEAAHTTTTRALVLWLIGGIFTPHLNNMPDTLTTIAEALTANGSLGHSRPHRLDTLPRRRPGSRRAVCGRRLRADPRRVVEATRPPARDQVP
jgi:hypothetical protein